MVTALHWRRLFSLGCARRHGEWTFGRSGGGVVDEKGEGRVEREEERRMNGEPVGAADRIALR